MATGVTAKPESKRSGRARAGQLLRRYEWTDDIRRNWPLYLMAMPAVLTVLVFRYGPLFGLSVKDYGLLLSSLNVIPLTLEYDRFVNTL